jgi:hypothetical protein
LFLYLLRVQKDTRVSSERKIESFSERGLYRRVLIWVGIEKRRDPKMLNKSLSFWFWTEWAVWPEVQTCEGRNPLRPISYKPYPAILVVQASYHFSGMIILWVRHRTLTPRHIQWHYVMPARNLKIQPRVPLSFKRLSVSKGLKAQNYSIHNPSKHLEPPLNFPQFSILPCLTIFFWAFWTTFERTT